MLHDLYTPWGQELADHPELIPWEEYPRPRMRREAWQNLNGNWEFAVSPTPTPPEEFPMTIRVPFAPESLLSGIGRHFAEGTRMKVPDYPSNREADERAFCSHCFFERDGAQVEGSQVGRPAYT